MQLNDPKWCQQYWLHWIKINSRDREKKWKRKFRRTNKLSELLNSYSAKKWKTLKCKLTFNIIDIVGCTIFRQLHLNQQQTLHFPLVFCSIYSNEFYLSFMVSVILSCWTRSERKRLDGGKRIEMTREKKYDYDMSNCEDRTRKENTTDSTMVCNMLGMIQTNESSSVCEWRVSDTSVN